MDFWAAFMRNEYAVLVSNAAEHDVFMAEFSAATDCKYGHEWRPSFPYLYWARNHVSGWTGTAGAYAIQKITFDQWCEMQTAPAEDTFQPDLSEVI